MSEGKQVMGRIDCPCCKTKEGMRITKDKNGMPFGFCDASCDAQLRVGGSAGRVAKFFIAYPNLDKAFNGSGAVGAPVVESKPSVLGGFSLGAL